MLGVDARRLHAERAQGGTQGLDHVPRATEEELPHLRRLEQPCGKLAHALRIEPPVVEFDLLRLTAHDEVQRELPEVAIFQRKQLLKAHGAARAAIAVEEQHPRASGQQRAHHRQHRRDAAAGGEGDVGCAREQRQARAETAVRWQHLERFPDTQLLGQVPRHAPLGMHARHYSQGPLPRGVHQRIGAPELFAADLGAHHHVLTRLAAVLRLKRRGHFEGERHRVLRVGGDLPHFEGMKLQHLRCT